MIYRSISTILEFIKEFKTFGIIRYTVYFSCSLVEPNGSVHNEPLSVAQNCPTVWDQILFQFFGLIKIKGQ